MTKSIAIIPSVQRNAGLNGYIEGNGMRAVAECTRSLLSRISGYEATILWPGLEDDYQQLPKLHRQQRDAEVWLGARSGSYAEKLALNLHSDSGATSHVYGLYGVASDGVRRESYKLAAAIAPAVARRMSIRQVWVTSRIGNLNYSNYVFYANQKYISALIECGSHQNAHDVDLLVHHPDVVARGIVDGVMVYFGDSAKAGGKSGQPGIVWRRGEFAVTAPGAIARSAPSRAGRILRPLSLCVLTTDGYTDGGQRVGGSSRWYHISKESGYGWVHSSGGQYTESKAGFSSQRGIR